MKFIKQTKIWQLPLILKLTATGFFLSGVDQLREIFEPCVSAKCSIGIISVFFAVLSIVIAVGIILRNNALMGCASIFVFPGVLLTLILLALVLFNDDGVLGDFSISYKFSVSERPWALMGLLAFLILQIKSFVALLNIPLALSEHNSSGKEEMPK